MKYGPIRLLVESPNELVVLSAHQEENRWVFRVNHFLGDMNAQGLLKRNLLVDDLTSEQLLVNSVLSFLNQTDEKDLAYFAGQITKHMAYPSIFLFNSRSCRRYNGKITRFF